MQHLTGFFDGQASEKPELHDLSPSRIDLGQRVQRFVQRADLRADLGTRARQIVEIDCGRMLGAIGLPTAFDGRTRPRGIDQNPSHHPCAHRVEMRAIGPIQISGIDQAQKRLVHERGGLQCVPGALVPHVPTRHAVQLLVDEWRQTIEGRRISASPGLQQTGDFRRLSRAPHWSVL